MASVSVNRRLFQILNGRTLSFLLVCTLLILVFQSQYYRIRSKISVSPPILAELTRQAEMALADREVPIGAVLTYADSIIGRGHNTVVRDSNLSAHAEINALIDAHRRMKLQWGSLDRSKMLMYSTYEPCDMCKGALLNTGIYNTIFEGKKPAREQVGHTLQAWKWEFCKKRLEAEGMQDSLFYRHPDFPGRRK